MWFLIKGSVFFAAVLVVLSYFSSKPASEIEGQAGGMSMMQMTSAISAASEAYSYVSAICTEKPDVCEKGAETFSALGIRAREGALVAFELLDKQFADENTKIAELSDPQPTAYPAPVSGKVAISIEPKLTTGTIPLPMKRPANP